MYVSSIYFYTKEMFIAYKYGFKSTVRPEFKNGEKIGDYLKKHWRNAAARLIRISDKLKAGAGILLFFLLKNWPMLWTLNPPNCLIMKWRMKNPFSPGT